MFRLIEKIVYIFCKTHGAGAGVISAAGVYGDKARSLLRHITDFFLLLYELVKFLRGMNAASH